MLRATKQDKSKKKGAKDKKYHSLDTMIFESVGNETYISSPMFGMLKANKKLVNMEEVSN